MTASVVAVGATIGTTLQPPDYSPIRKFISPPQALIRCRLPANPTAHHRKATQMEYNSLQLLFSEHLMRHIFGAALLSCPPFRTRGSN